MTPAERPSDDMSQEDQDLLDALFLALQTAEALPESAAQSAYAAHLMGDVEADLARLIYDSAAEQVAVRRSDGDHASRFLSFANEYLTLDLSLLADGQGLVGEIDPPMADQVIIEGRDGTKSTVPVDNFGRFRAHCESPSFRIVIDGLLFTQWITR